MARKGQKFKRYTFEFKDMILKEYLENGVSSYALEKKYGVPNHTVREWTRKIKHEIDVRVDHRPGNTGRRKSKNLTLEDYKERYEILKKYQAFLQARRGKK